MVAAVLKLYFVGTMLSVLAVLYGMVDSVGGLMYVQDRPYVLDQRLPSGRHRRATPPAKNVGS